MEQWNHWIHLLGRPFFSRFSRRVDIRKISFPFPLLKVTSVRKPLFFPSRSNADRVSARSSSLSQASSLFSGSETLKTSFSSPSSQNAAVFGSVFRDRILSILFWGESLLLFPEPTSAAFFFLFFLSSLSLTS